MSRNAKRRSVPFESAAAELHASDEDLNSDEEEAAEHRGRENQEKNEDDHTTIEDQRLLWATKFLAKEGSGALGTNDEGDDDQGNGEDGDESDVKGALGTDSLKRARLVATGGFCRRIADSLLPHASELAKGMNPCRTRDSESASSLEGASSLPQEAQYQWMTGHQLPLTCVCLSPDDRHAFTGGKDNALIQYDLETAKRVGYLRRAWKRAGNDSGGEVGGTKARHGEVLCVGVSGDGRLLASGGRDKLVHLYDLRALQAVDVVNLEGTSVGGGMSHTSTGGRGTRAFELRSFRGHKDAVTGVAFQQGGGGAASQVTGAQTLFSASSDRTLKLWNAKDMGFLDTLYGHQNEVNGLDVLRREVAVTAGRDCSARLWKWGEDKQLVFRGPSSSSSIECTRMLSEDTFVTGDDSGRLAIWSHLKKKPAMTVEATIAPIPVVGSTHSELPWISSLSSVRGADLVASGSCDGFVRLWKASGVNGGQRSLTAVAALPVPGFVNGLAFSRDGKLLLAATGQEHRLGRWSRIQGGGARNGLAVVALPVPTATPERGD
eukprot:CAMPEP_0171946358 /NCGR_PEP_ID=MMETSP0993-20121228/53179_1 /TAXON_ID=483369 /ORGANISM="non described non described, Strain CCMP2098" /LENGTH=548 /DNA_ID=CAMNT_0012589705 /DNA_START=26 /DNA_END=1672 /DNA_ORIENTATION=+